MTHEDIAQLMTFIAIVLLVGIAVYGLCEAIDDRW